MFEGLGVDVGGSVGGGPGTVEPPQAVNMSAADSAIAGARTTPIHRRDRVFGNIAHLLLRHECAMSALALDYIVAWIAMPMLP
jgi:hypothetical protein